MARLQLALNVDDLDAAVDFYSRLFATPPAKRHAGYANFAVADPPLKLVLFEGGQPGTLNHLGIEVESVTEVTTARERLAGEGLTPVEDSGVCCFADQAKIWVTGPDGQRWEVYTVLADSPTFGRDQDGDRCCAEG